MVDQSRKKRVSEGGWWRSKRRELASIGNGQQYATLAVEGAVASEGPDKQGGNRGVGGVGAGVREKRLMREE